MFYCLCYVEPLQIILHMNNSNLLRIALLTVFPKLFALEGIEDKGCCPTLISNWDFDTQCPMFDGPNPDWFLFEIYGFTANDGVLTCGPNGGFLNSNPFTLTVPNHPAPSLDSLKWLGYDSTPKDVPPGGQLALEWEMSAKVLNTVPNPFPEGVTQGPNDFRYGSAACSVADFDNRLGFELLMTNDRVYAVYSRLSYHKYGLDNAFTYVIPVAKRCSADFIKLKIVIDDESKSVRYYVNNIKGLEVFNVALYIPGEYPVLDYDNPPELVFPSSIYMGFGTYTAVGSYPAATEPNHRSTHDRLNFPPIREGLTNCADNIADPLYNPVLGPYTRATYWDIHGVYEGHHIWGQGVEVRIKKMSAFVSTPCILA